MFDLNFEQTLNKTRKKMARKIWKVQQGPLGGVGSRNLGWKGMDILAWIPFFCLVTLNYIRMGIPFQPSFLHFQGIAVPLIREGVPFHSQSLVHKDYFAPFQYCIDYQKKYIALISLTLPWFLLPLSLAMLPEHL